MVDKPSHQGLVGSRKFIPQVKPLESRLLLSRSQQLGFPDGASVFVTTFPLLPRTGGVFAQSGSVLSVGVGQPTTNSAQVTDDGIGDVTAEWNGLPNHVLTGINTTVIQLERARSDQVTINLTSARTGPAHVAGGSLMPMDAARASGHSDLTAMATRNRTSGTAVQSGSVLTVSVNAPKSNTVAVSNEGSGAVVVEWNAGADHSFTGVATIVVDTAKAKNNVVALHDTTG